MKCLSVSLNCNSMNSKFNLLFQAIFIAIQKRFMVLDNYFRVKKYQSKDFKYYL